MMALTFRTILVMGLALAAKASAGTFSLSAPLTTDASTQISSSTTYTHAITGGGPATVNGVVFSVLNSTTTPTNFTWVSAGGKGEVVNNNNNWTPASGGVTGPGLLSLLGSLSYAPTGAAPGSFQTYTLSGLNVGTIYDTRIYLRSWDTALTSSGRPADLTMTNGAESNPFSLMEDNPGTVLGTGNINQAYYLNYRFTAQTTSLVLTATVPTGAPANSGSFHIYGITNQAVPEPASGLILMLTGGLYALRRRRVH